MIVYRRLINMVPGGQVAVVNMSQYDSDVTLEFELYASEGTFVVQDGTTVLIRGTKPDGNGISLDGTLESTQDPETGQYVHLVTVEVTQQMTAVAGKSLYELSLRYDGEELNTANFVLDIERAPLDKDTLPSESVIRELVDVIDEADDIIAAAQQVEDALDDLDSLSYFDNRKIAIGIRAVGYKVDRSTGKIVARGTSGNYVCTYGTLQLRAGEEISCINKDYGLAIFKFSTFVTSAENTDLAGTLVYEQEGVSKFVVETDGFYAIEAHKLDGTSVPSTNAYETWNYILWVKPIKYLALNNGSYAIPISESIYNSSTYGGITGTILYNPSSNRINTIIGVQAPMKLTVSNGYKYNIVKFEGNTTISSVSMTSSGWVTDTEYDLSVPGVYGIIIGTPDDTPFVYSQLQSVLDSFVFTAADIAQDVISEVEQFIDGDHTIYTGTDFVVGESSKGISVTDSGSATEIYIEDKSKSIVTAEGSYAASSVFTFVSENRKTHVSGTYSGSSAVEFGGYIYNGYFSATQGSGNKDAVMKNDGNDYYLTCYVKGLKAGQKCRFRFRSGSTNVFSDNNISADRPFVTKKMTKEAISQYGDIGVAVYFYNITSNVDATIYVTVSTTGFMADLVSENENVLISMSDAHVAADSSVSVKKVGMTEQIIETVLETTDERYVSQEVEKDEKLSQNLFYDSEIKHTEVRGDYRFNAATFDTANNKFYVLGGAVDRAGSSKLLCFSDWNNPTQSATSNIIQAGHSNDITYDPVNDRLLIACGQSSNDGSGENQYSNTIKVVDPSTLEITDTISFDSSWIIQGVEYGDGYIYLFIMSGTSYIVQKRSLDLTTIIKTRTYVKADVLTWTGYTDGRNLFFQGMAYNPDNGIVYHITSGRGRYSNSYGHYYNGILLGLDDDLNFVHAISFDLDAREELQGYIFGGDLYDYALSDGVYGVYRVIPKRIQSTHTREYIPPNSDLNDYISIGEYFCNNAENAATIVNNPDKNYGFTLSVRPNSIACRLQILFSNGADIYVRMFNATAWTNWKKVTMDVLE